MNILAKKQKDFRREVSRLSAIANKRIKRLSESDYTQSPAYQKWLNAGGDRFGIKGKTQQEVWQEYYRVKDYLDSKTSSITGSKEVLKNINEYTGLHLDDVLDVQSVADDYFRLANRVAEYVNISGLGAIYDSNQIFNNISTVIDDYELDVDHLNVDAMLSLVVDRIDTSYYNRVNKPPSLKDYKRLD